MEKLTSNLESIGDRVRASLSAKHAAREKALQLSREVIRNCANAIRAVHRREYEQAKTLLVAARGLLNEMKEVLAEHSGLLHAGFVHDAQKEYAEGSITLALITHGALPDPDELDISYAAYLNGLGEAVGELRRHLLDSMREGEVSRCEQLLGAMDDIFFLLVTIDFPDALTGGLRRTTDVVRGVLEKTRGDLTMACLQKDLESRLGTFGQQMGHRDL